MHSFEEIRFRLRQELWNLSAWLRPPTAGGVKIPEAPLQAFAAPGDARARVAGTPFAVELERIASCVLQHRFPIFGGVIDTGPRIAWRRDYVNGRENGLDYIRRVPYLDFDRAGDHKVIWELNRHQHLVVLAQAYCLTGREEYGREISAQLDSWFEANPPLRGINWTSALEVAFRAFSWMWVWHLAGGAVERTRLLEGLHQHGCYLERNLSVYFSPNTHLLGEAVVLHALGKLFPQFPRAEQWRGLGRQVVEEQMEAQVRADGMHFEQSTYYHVYALDFFLLHALLADVPTSYRDKLVRMAEFLHAVMGPARRLPFIGDDDGGRLFHPYGERSLFGRATLATVGLLLNRPEWIGSAEDVWPQAAWWLPDVPAMAPVSALHESRLYADSGFAVLTNGGVHAVAKPGPFGPWTGGHSHSDVLSFTLSVDDRDILIDPGTYTYVSDMTWRNRFRGSGAHNTVRVDGRDQAVPAGPFGWSDKPEAKILEWRTDAAADYLDAECRFSDFRCRRRILFRKTDYIVVVDEVTASDDAEHRVEQTWHLGAEPERRSEHSFALAGVSIEFSENARVEVREGWRSRVLGTKEPSHVLLAERTGARSVVLEAGFDLSGRGTDLATMRHSLEQY